MKTDNNQIERWILPQPLNKEELINCKINYTLQKVLCRRGINLEEELIDFLTPSNLPNPEDHFDELNKATKRIIEACVRKEKIAICGDYDADGITSTVLLIELLSKLGANPISYIPSRKEDGYGLNIKMIDNIHNNQIHLIITVDNGISAFKAIQRSKELDIDLIITDHHKIPGVKLDIYALIHPERSPENSPYRYLAGVGIAFMLAKNICKKINFNIEDTTAHVLFCIGTVADMAPLIGANRKWLKDYLPRINSTNNIGIRTIIKKLSIEDTEITSEDIGYKIAPLINAVGRINDPKLIVDLLTTTSQENANNLTKTLFTINKERKRLTTLVETEALELATSEYSKNNQFLVLTKKEWNHGIIGIVAARIVDRFNLPTAIISEANNGMYRGSIRSNSQLNVNLALNECTDILIAHGGHAAAAGLTIKEENIPKLKLMLNNIAMREFKNCNLNKSIKPDAHISLRDINHEFYRQLKLLGPFGMMNNTPIFWTRKCRILDLYNLRGNHLKMKLDDGTAFIEAIKWNYSSNLKINDLIDIAFYIEINKWKKQNKIQLNIVDIKKFNNTIDLQLHNMNYKCNLTQDKKIKITNSKGQSITSDLSILSNKENVKLDGFTKKILSFAEIALGKTA